MDWTDIRGHADQIAMLERSVRRGRLPHGLLFLGPSGIGKRLVATRVAMTLLCERRAAGEFHPCGECPSCRQMRAGTHPDFLPVGVPDGKNELTIDVLLGPKERRGEEGLLHNLSLRPMISRRRIALIDDADRMNIEAANALLKTLEEPPADAILILIASSEESLLPTIRSRCQSLRFAPLPTHDLADLLLQQEKVATPEDAEQVSRLAGGSLSVAEQLLDPNLRQLRDTLLKGLTSRLPNAVELAAQVAAGLDDLGGSTAEQRQHAQWLIRFFAEFLRQTQRVMSGDIDVPQDPNGANSAEFAERLRQGHRDPSEQCGAMLERLVDASDQIGRNSPLGLIFEALFAALVRLAKPNKRRAAS